MSNELMVQRHRYPQEPGFCRNSSYHRELFIPGVAKCSGSVMSIELLRYYQIQFFSSCDISRKAACWINSKNKPGSYKTWHNLVSVYSECRLMFHNDKLAGLASRFALQWAIQSSSYLAGLWKETLLTTCCGLYSIGRANRIPIERLLDLGHDSMEKFLAILFRDSLVSRSLQLRRSQLVTCLAALLEAVLSSKDLCAK
jgi:hypothetical protein